MIYCPKYKRYFINNSVSKWDIIMKQIDEMELCEYYTSNLVALRDVSRKYDIDHHRVKRILLKHGVYDETRFIPIIRDPESTKKGVETRIKKGSYVAHNKGKKASETQKRANMKSKMKTDITLDEYDDYDRLLFLTRYLAKHKKHFDTDEKRKEFLDKFYLDEQFNLIYSRWIKDKNKWLRPSLDHKNPQSNGGSFDLDNLHFLTWFENRAKADMTEDEWKEFRAQTNTHSDYFIRKQ